MTYLTLAARPALYMQIGRKRYQVASLQEASEMFCAARNKSDLGASRTPDVTIVNERGETVGRVSYNGRVWPAVKWTPDQKPIYDNRIGAAS